MDTERLSYVLSTALILTTIVFFVLPNFGYDDPQARLLATAALAVVFSLPVAGYMVYLRDGDEESHYFGPWGPGDVFFLAVLVPGLFGTTRLAEAYDLGGVLYWLVVLVGLLASIAAGAVVRALVIGEWPPGASAREARDEESGPF